MKILYSRVLFFAEVAIDVLACSGMALRDQTSPSMFDVFSFLFSKVLSFHFFSFSLRFCFVSLF